MPALPHLDEAEDMIARRVALPENLVGVLKDRRGDGPGDAELGDPDGAGRYAFGPALGGLLTQLISWEAIFFIQVPAILLALVGVALFQACWGLAIARTSPSLGSISYEPEPSLVHTWPASPAFHECE